MSSFNNTLFSIDNSTSFNNTLFSIDNSTNFNNFTGTARQEGDNNAYLPIVIGVVAGIVAIAAIIFVGLCVKKKVTDSHRTQGNTYHRPELVKFKQPRPIKSLVAPSDTIDAASSQNPMISVGIHRN